MMRIPVHSPSRLLTVPAGDKLIEARGKAKAPEGADECYRVGTPRQQTVDGEAGLHHTLVNRASLYIKQRSKPSHERGRFRPFRVQHSVVHGLMELPACHASHVCNSAFLRCGALNCAPASTASPTHFLANSYKSRPVSGTSRIRKSSSMPANLLSGMTQTPKRTPSRSNTSRPSSGKSSGNAGKRSRHLSLI